VTAADFTGVDIDLLADYVGGALEGTPDEARVAALIVDDPAWRDAHALLSDGMAEVGDALGAWGAEPEPMPAEITARLEAAIAELAEPAPAAVPAAGRHLTVVRETGVDRETARRPSPRRRRLRWGAPIAAAAAVVAFAGVGFNYLAGASSTDNASSSAAGTGLTAQAAEGSASLSAGKIISSGTDYDAGSLAVGPSEPLQAPAPSAPTPRVASSDQVSAAEATPDGTAKADTGLVDPLARLRPREALQVCLDEIAAKNGAGPITVQTVDYARFSGEPALVVRFTAANGAWVWASSPDCGLPGVGASTRDSVRVG